jgi:predicted RNA methylase
MRPGKRTLRNAPFITSPDRVVDEMVKLADLTEQDVVYDLGCGDGRIVVTAALQSGCRGVGYDIDPKLVAEATRNAEEHGVGDRVDIVEQDIFSVDLSQADVCMMYLLPWMMNKLVPQFEQMKPGSRIVVHEFWIEQVVPDRIVEIPVEEKNLVCVYLYTTPLRHDPSMEIGKPPRVENVVRVSPAVQALSE